jgi:hypothetical protein
MRKQGLLATMLLLVCAIPAHAQTAALAGRVSSQEEGNMEGVVVRAKKAGSTITVSVVTDAQGHYRFPAERLDAGQYGLSIRAAGYMLEGPDNVTITAQKNASADLKLRKATVDETASQLSDVEWLMSMPGTPAQKQALRGCNHCHTLERIARSKFDPAAALATIERMSRYTPASFPHLIQPNSPGRIGAGPSTPEARERLAANRQLLAEYISTINLSAAPTWAYELKTLPRPSGKATRVIYTEFDMPARTRQPHDVIIDSQGLCLVRQLRRADPRAPRSQDRRRQGMAHSRVETGPQQGRARCRVRRRRKYLGRQRLPERHPDVRPQDRNLEELPPAAGAGR